MEKLLDAEEVAALIKISRRKFEAMLKDGAGPTYMRLGGIRRWRPKDIERWSEEQIAKQERAAK